MRDAHFEELSALISMSCKAQTAGAHDVEHINGAAGAFHSIRVANLVSAYCGPGRSTQPVLDWGCGYGQVTWLLRRRGIEVVSCDAEKRAAIDSIPELASIPIHYLDHPVRLPYPSNSFSAVLSTGVLEHVPDLEGSLEEIYRVLRPQGLFFLLMFPNLFSWAEQIASLRGISVHPHKFTFRRTKAILQAQGFRIKKKWRRNLLPKNLTGLNPGIKAMYGRYYRQIESFDRTLCRVPVLSWLSGVLELIATK